MEENRSFLSSSDLGMFEDEKADTSIHFHAENDEEVYEAHGSFVNTYTSPIMMEEPEEEESLASGISAAGRGKRLADLRAEISDLNLKLQKQTDDNSILKSRLRDATEDYFSSLQSQRDELDKKGSELKSSKDKLKRLERELNDKNSHVSSVEDKNILLVSRITRLESECSAYQKEGKELHVEIEELKAEAQKGSRILAKKEEELEKIRESVELAEEQWTEKVEGLEEQLTQFKGIVDQLSEKVEELQLEKLELEMKTNEECGIDHYPSPVLEALVSDVMDISLDDIEAELLVAQGRSPVKDEEEMLASMKFDVGIQCEDGEQRDLLVEVSKMIASIRKVIENGGEDNAQDPDQLSGCSIVAVAVRQINQELVGYLEQLKTTRKAEEMARLPVMLEASQPGSSVSSQALGFSVMFMMIGLLVLLWGFLPSLSAVDNGCLANPSFFKGVGDYFSHCGELSYDDIPII